MYHCTCQALRRLHLVAIETLVLRLKQIRIRQKGCKLSERTAACPQ